MISEEIAPKSVFVRRDAGGQICSVSLRQDDWHRERISSAEPAVTQFLAALSEEGRDRELAASDAELSRVLEDLIDVLINKGFLAITDLPEVAQRKLFRRRTLRRALQHDILVDDRGLI